MDVDAREATLDDAEAIQAVATQIADELRPLRGGHMLLARQPVGTTESAELRPNAPARVIVGTIDDVVVGFATVDIETLNDGARLGIIREICVLPGARGVGVGEALLGDALAFCRTRNCQGVDAVALPGARETKNFFETFGLTARALVVHTPLDRAP